MVSCHHIFISSPTCYAGRSKSAANEVLNLIDLKKCHLIILTTPPQSWRIEHTNIISRLATATSLALSYQVEQCYVFFLTALNKHSSMPVRV